MPIYSRRVLAVILAVGLSTAAASPVGAATETVLHVFQGGADGAVPVAPPIKWHGILYGTTQNGGSSDNGTVYSLTPAGVETVLYSFKGGSDGARPDAGLVNVGGTFYGATLSGGGGTACSSGGIGCGTVFSVTPAGVEKVLYAFPGGADGAFPFSDLIDVNGTLYGTTSEGGGTGCGGIGCGTVFSLTPAGAHTVLYAFQGGADGASPLAALLDDGGMLYGTTTVGGGADCSAFGLSGCGTVFSVTPAGVETVLYAFKAGKDGYYAQSSLIDVGGTLYGATVHGGGTREGRGTVFSVTTAGVETVLYAFRHGGRRGDRPYEGGLVELYGKLFGTTELGGARNNGTVFSVTPAGAQKVVYSFQLGDGSTHPSAGLTKMNGTLYGATSFGGGTGCGGGGCGTVFSVTP